MIEAAAVWLVILLFLLFGKVCYILGERHEAERQEHLRELEDAEQHVDDLVRKWETRG